MRYRQGAMQGPPKPKATYGLLIAIGVIWLLEWIVALFLGEDAFIAIFTIYAPESWYGWIYRPWSPFTSTMSHSISSFFHIFINGIVLYFFGPTIEAVLGLRKYLIFFFATGALSGIIQASGLLEILIFGQVTPVPALGASGAIMALIGMSIVLMPKQKIFIFPFPIPIPLWIAGLGFALIDVLGVFNPASTVGNIAHLSGMAIGLVYGVYVKKDLERRGLQLVAG